MSEEWPMVLAVVALGLGFVNTLTLIAHGLGLASRMDEWREEQRAQHREAMTTAQDTLQRLERIERLERGEPLITTGDDLEEARG